METPPSLFVRQSVIGLIALVLGLCFDYFFYDKTPGLSWPLYIALLVGCFAALSIYLKAPRAKFVLWLLIPLFFFSGMVAVRDSELLTTLNIMATCLVLLAMVNVATEKTWTQNVLADYIAMIFLPFAFLGPAFRTLSDIIHLRGLNKDNKNFSHVVRGVALTVPLLLIFIVLFASADEIFKEIVHDIIDIQLNIFWHVILIGAVTIILLGALTYIFLTTEKTESTDTAPTKKNDIHRIELGIVLGSINVLFFIFIVVQLSYLFGGENTIVTEGYTYAAYARRGFSELIIVALITFGLIRVFEKRVSQPASVQPPLFKLLSGLLIIQVMPIMASAFIRLWLYEQAYGFTVLRLYSHTFIIFLAIIFCFLLYKIVVGQRESRFVLQNIILAMLWLAAMNIVNPDAFIARQNIERFYATGKLDAYNLLALSNDALPEIIALLNNSNETLHHGLAHHLSWRATEVEHEPSFVRWQSFNVSRRNALKMYRSIKSELEQYKNSDFRRYLTEYR